ncbi:N,N-dimethylformamidase beta subunit family domain-containing protein [Ruegeria arenilitoris]|uniref:N,N-dimethylformamidase beta subunit family domain-containing protein n=1 Tax=Ruegeria arenilitoris TaxID=1173585 RepID=UPI00147A44FB|nr:N,N-dimethylformamidase beta subunit family domain-containing protein [Ruegeria arenilitoris]
MTSSEGPSPATTPRTRAKARHILDNYYIGPARDDAVLEIWGYTPRMSYAPGETVALHVSTTAEKWDFEVGRDGLVYEPLLRQQGLTGCHQETPDDCSVKGCDWQVSHQFTIPTDWRPGGYLITLSAERDGDRVEEHHLILVRSDINTPSPRMVMICATGTWLAYNCWGGSNHYEGITGPEGNAFSPVVSTQRPWSRGFCKLPTGAPRAVPEVPHTPGNMVRYPYMEWAYAYGYSKKYASAGWASYERHFARWLEAEGFEYDMATQHDLEAQPDLLDRYKCAVFVGHDEYWSANMRRSVDRFTENGGKVARFAGNFLWQTRIENEGRTQVCYKYKADQDPLKGTDQEHLVTAAWEVPPVNWPGARTFGANGLKGVYAGLGRCVGQGSGGFTVYRPDHWALAGTQLGYGDQLGAGARIFGYEVDGVDYQMEDGLPFATGKDGADPNMVILAMGLATNIEPDHGIWGETLYIGDEDARFKAKAQFGADTPENLDRSKRGNGVILHWERGKGEVFTAGTCEWVMGLICKDQQVERITRNVLNRFCTAD